MQEPIVVEPNFEAVMMFKEEVMPHFRFRAVEPQTVQNLSNLSRIHFSLWWILLVKISLSNISTPLSMQKVR